MLLTGYIQNHNIQYHTLYYTINSETYWSANTITLYSMYRLMLTGFNNTIVTLTYNSLAPQLGK